MEIKTVAIPFESGHLSTRYWHELSKEERKKIIFSRNPF